MTLDGEYPNPAFAGPSQGPQVIYLVEVDLRADRLENSLRWGGPRSLGKSFSCVDATDQDGDGYRAAARLGELPVETRRCARAPPDLPKNQPA
jgi:hypothetical protein